MIGTQNPKPKTQNPNPPFTTLGFRAFAARQSALQGPARPPLENGTCILAGIWAQWASTFAASRAKVCRGISGKKADWAKERRWDGVGSAPNFFPQGDFRHGGEWGTAFCHEDVICLGDRLLQQMCTSCRLYLVILGCLVGFWR